MTIFLRSRVFFNNFLQKKTFQDWVFQNRSYVCKTTPKIFLKFSRRNGSDSSLLFLFRNGLS